MRRKSLGLAVLGLVLGGSVGVLLDTALRGDAAPPEPVAAQRPAVPSAAREAWLRAEVDPMIRPHSEWFRRFLTQGADYRATEDDRRRAALYLQANEQALRRMQARPDLFLDDPEGRDLYSKAAAAATILNALLSR